MVQFDETCNHLSLGSFFDDPGRSLAGIFFGVGILEVCFVIRNHLVVKLVFGRCRLDMRRC